MVCLLQIGRCVQFHSCCFILKHSIRCFSYSMQLHTYKCKRFNLYSLQFFFPSRKCSNFQGPPATTKPHCPLPCCSNFCGVSLCTTETNTRHYGYVNRRKPRNLNFSCKTSIAKYFIRNMKKHLLLLQWIRRPWSVGLEYTDRIVTTTNYRHEKNIAFKQKFKQI
jgi:hypothetical protein